MKEVCPPKKGYGLCRKNRDAKYNQRVYTPPLSRAVRRQEETALAPSQTSAILDLQTSLWSENIQPRRGAKRDKGTGVLYSFYSPEMKKKQLNLARRRREPQVPDS